MAEDSSERPALRLAPPDETEFGPGREYAAFAQRLRELAEMYPEVAADLGPAASALEGIADQEGLTYRAEDLMATVDYGLDPYDFQSREPADTRLDVLLGQRVA